jgi:2-polyprenyl-6-methoxyphenol hydroxylase-like FAD-dependent oxidoreductase
MKAHIVGGGFGGLAAAAYLIQHAGFNNDDPFAPTPRARLRAGVVCGRGLQRYESPT